MKTRLACSVFGFGLLLVVGCGGGVSSGLALGKVADEVGAQAASTPQGGELCLVKEALAQANIGEKPMSDACTKALKKDRMYRRTMLALAAYGDTVTALSSGQGDDHTGRAEAASTGIEGSDWVDVDSADSAARDAAAALVAHFRDHAKDDDLEALVKGAAPHVKTLCDGLIPYLESQETGFGDARRDVEKKRLAKIERRCGAIDNKTVCVSDSATDRVVYATTLGQLALSEGNAGEARAAVGGFCAAHAKLEEAAAAGKLKSDETMDAVVAAIASARKAPAAVTPAPASKK
jgi:hypothetical protein